MIVRRLARCLEPLPGAVQALLGAPGDRDSVRWLSVVAIGQRAADGGALAVVPCGLDEQPAGVWR